jgi:D-alanyl-D-alanine dipeptidase
MDPFKNNLSAFLSAMNASGAGVSIAATYRPAERAYLMHWSWMIAKKGKNPQSIPPHVGVSIRWDHIDARGDYSAEESKSAALAMVSGYSIQDLKTAPALDSRHTHGCAVDMTISWSRTLSIVNASGSAVAISTEPRNGMNADLAEVGATFSVIKYNGPGEDRPHWSDTGR